MPEELGQAAEGGNPIESAPESSGESEAQKFTVKVGGVEQEITLEEALNGYMRQADYTRKSQTLAAQRQEIERAAQIQRALEVNPEATLRALAAEYEIEFGDYDDPDEEEDSPAARRLKALEAEIATLRSREVDRMVEAEINELRSKFDVDDERLEEVMAHATRTQQTLKAAFKDLFFDEAFEALKATRTRKQAEQAIKDDKFEGAASVPHLGVGGSGTTKPKVERPKNFREAYALAKQGIRVED